MIGRMLLRFTILWLGVYFPLETFASLRGAGVFTFSYLIDLVGMGLLAAGVVGTHRRRPLGHGLLVAGWAWTSANFWRGTTERFWTVADGRHLQFGSIELWLGPLVTAIAILAMAASIAATRRDVSVTAAR